VQENNLLKEIAASQRTLLERLDESRLAEIAISKSDRPQSVIKLDLDLSKEQTLLLPRNIGYAFKSLFVEHCDDPTAKIFVRPTTTEEYQSAFQLGYRDSWSVQRAIPDAFLHWPAQVGFMRLIIFTDSEFKSGSQVSLTSGGVSISEGLAVSNRVETLPAAVTTSILPTNFLRKVATIQNKTGGEVFIGGSTVTDSGLTQGISIAAGQSFNWKNSGELFAYSTGGGNLIVLEQQ
jgi:hypothetical protein